MPIVMKPMNPPSQANLRPMKSRNAPTVPSRLLDPSNDSAISSGTAHTRFATPSAIRNDPPPHSPTTRGNRQRLPVPTAIPMAAATKVNRFLNTSPATAAPSETTPVRASADRRSDPARSDDVIRVTSVWQGSQSPPGAEPGPSAPESSSVEGLEEHGGDLATVLPEATDLDVAPGAVERQRCLIR